MTKCGNLLAILFSVGVQGGQIASDWRGSNCCWIWFGSCCCTTTIRNIKRIRGIAPILLAVIDKKMVKSKLNRRPAGAMHTGRFSMFLPHTMNSWRKVLGKLKSRILKLKTIPQLSELIIKMKLLQNCRAWLAFTNAYKMMGALNARALNLHIVLKYFRCFVKKRITSFTIIFC